MKRLELTPVEVRTLRDMGIFHSHPRTRMRAQAIVRLSQGLTLQQVANEFAVHLNSVEHWRQRWNKDGLTGLYEGHHSGRPPKWNEAQQQALRDPGQPARRHCGSAAPSDWADRTAAIRERLYD